MGENGDTGHLKTRLGKYPVGRSRAQQDQREQKFPVVQNGQHILRMGYVTFNLSRFPSVL